MESVKEGETFLDEHGWLYEVISRHNGYTILFHKSSACQWVLRHPDGRIDRFETENDLWQYALNNKLFNEKG